MTVPAYLLRFVPLASANVALSILALERFWFWFVAPLGVPEIGFAHAFGLRLAVHLFTSSGVVTPPAPDNGADAEHYRALSLRQQASGVATSAVLLAIGWAIQ